MDAEIEIVTDEARLRPENTEVERLWADNAKARELFGWQPGYGGRDGSSAAWPKPSTGSRNPRTCAATRRNLQPVSAVIDQSTLAEQVVDAIRAVVGTEPVALHEPSFAGNEWALCQGVPRLTFVSSVGKFVDRFEADLAAFTGAKHAVAVVNGTAALHVALQLAGVEAGDEVLIPALTFVATANAVTYCGATPHFVDSEERTLGIDAARAARLPASDTEQRAGQCVNRATGRVIRALVPMHTFGHPVDLDGLLAVARDFNLALVEDAAESLGSYYHGRHTGTSG